MRELVATQLVKLKGRFVPRHAFGSFYGALRLNYPAYIITILEEEILLYELAHTSPEEIVDLIEALSLNTSWPAQNKKIIMQEWFEEYVNNNWRKYFQYFPVRLLPIIKALDRMEYYSTDTLFRCINAYSGLIHYKLDV